MVHDIQDHNGTARDLNLDPQQKILVVSILLNICITDIRDPYEEQPLDLSEHAETVAALKKLAVEEHSKSLFPPHYSNVVDAMPGNNDGNFTSGWC